MKLTIEIEMDNAAFEDNNTAEACRILRNYAAHIERGGDLADGDHANLYDANGNHVGTAEVSE